MMPAVRNPVACIACRSAKQKCTHDDHPPCERCRATGRADTCRFPRPGTSSLHRQSKKLIVSRRTPSNQGGGFTATNNGTSEGFSSPYGAGGGGSGGVKDEYGVADRFGTSAGAGSSLASPRPRPTKRNAPVAGVDPVTHFTEEMKRNYLAGSYAWFFHHTPTLLQQFREFSLEPWLIWAIMAVSVRSCNQAPHPFSSTADASSTFASHARSLLQDDLETPSLTKIQALLLLTEQDWGTGNGSRAWIFLGMAIRMVQIMDLTERPSWSSASEISREDLIDQEQRRRTAWACFLLDSLLSGGKGRRRTLSREDMEIQLPMPELDFALGRPESTKHYLAGMQNSSKSSDLDIAALTVRIADRWGAIARATGSNTILSPLPWAEESDFQKLSSDLQRWNQSLDAKFIHEPYSISAHHAIGVGRAYCHMRCIYNSATIMLHRLAIMVAIHPKLQEQMKEQQTGDSNAQVEHHRWASECDQVLIGSAKQISDMVHEIRDLGRDFSQALVPYVGFTVYLAAGIFLDHFFDEKDPAESQQHKESFIACCLLLREMKSTWPTASTWLESLMRINTYAGITRPKSNPTETKPPSIGNQNQDTVKAEAETPAQGAQSDGDRANSDGPGGPWRAVNSESNRDSEPGAAQNSGTQQRQSSSSQPPSVGGSPNHLNANQGHNAANDVDDMDIEEHLNNQEQEQDDDDNAESHMLLRTGDILELGFAREELFSEPETALKEAELRFWTAFPGDGAQAA